MRRKIHFINRIILPLFLFVLLCETSLKVNAAETITARSASDTYGNVFLGGNFIEVGVSKSGSFGTSKPAPTVFGSHAKSSGAVGLISDGDGWGIGAAPTTGDFFLPGSPEERYIVGYYYNGSIRNYNVADRQNVSTTNWKVAPTTVNQTEGNHLKAVTTGITAENIQYTQTVEFDVNDKEFLTTIEIKNIGSTTITQCRYVRSFDPDQDQYTQGVYTTYNKVISNPRTTSYNKEKDVAMVVARGSTTLDGFFFAAFDQRARASRGVAFSPNSAFLSGLWYNSTSLPTEPLDTSLAMNKSSLNGYTYEDSAIALTFDLGNLDSGKTVSFNYYSSLDPNVIESLSKIKALFASVSANEKDHTIGPFEAGVYEVFDGTTTYTLDIASNDSQVPMQGTDKYGQEYNFAGKTISLVLKGDGVNVEDSDPQLLDIPEQFNYEGTITVNHGNVPENIRLAAAILHLQMRENDTAEWYDVTTKVIVFNKNKQIQNIPYSFPDLWVRWLDESKPDYQYRIVIDADNYKGANVPTTDRNLSISYTAVLGEKNPMERTTLVFDDNGGTGGTGAINLFDEMKIPDTIEIPTRIGYRFAGYFKGFLGGTMYYDAEGKKQNVDQYDKPWETSPTLAGYTIYANWIINSSTVVIDAAGGTIVGEASYAGDYGSSITIPNPVRDGYTFLKWLPSSSNGTLTEALSSSYYQFGATTEAVTLTAVWYQERQAQFEKTANVTEDVGCEKICQIFRNTVTDNTKGLTEEDFRSSDIVIKVSVDEAPEEAGAPIENLIKNQSDNDQVLKFYDISVNKTVDGTKTQLVELPSTITVSIPLTGDLAGQNGYAVYRIHEGVSERISASPSATEYYEVKDDVLYIHTKKFSVYGVVAMTSSISGNELTDENRASDGNVYARYIDGSMKGVYKIDIAWGTMKYDFTKTKRWNPEMHRYEYDIELDEASAYDGVNNKLLVTNHSNGDVRVSAVISNSHDFDGIGMDIKTTNDEAGELLTATDVAKVSDDSGSGLVSTVAGYVRLDAMMNETAASKFIDPDTYYKVGTITVTIEDLAGNFTPMTN